MGLTLAQLSTRLSCAECGGPLQSVKPWRQADVLGSSRVGWNLPYARLSRLLFFLPHRRRATGAQVALARRRGKLSNIDPFNKVDAVLRGICWPPGVAGPIRLHWLRFFSRLKRPLDVVVRDRPPRWHLSVHDPRGRTGTETDGYQQRFRMI